MKLTVVIDVGVEVEVDVEWGRLLTHVPQVLAVKKAAAWHELPHIGAPCLTIIERGG